MSAGRTAAHPPGSRGRRSARPAAVAALWTRTPCGQYRRCPAGIEDLFADEHERLYRALYLIVGSSHDAEELMQDAFFRVLERWDRIDNPAVYMFRSAFNAFANVA